MMTVNMVGMSIQYIVIFFRFATYTAPTFRRGCVAARLLLNFVVTLMDTDGVYDY